MSKLWPIIEKDDSVAIVLGAGATISEMFMPEEPKIPPPADANFLKIAKKCEPRAFAELERLFEEVWDNGAAYPIQFQRMEQLFAGAYLRVLQTNGKYSPGRCARKLLDQLVLILRDTLVKTTGKARPDQHIELLSAIMACRPAALSIISFNYDLLVDRALRFGSKEGRWNWSHKDGYGFTPANQPPSPKTSSEISLLKLHGSMNWYIPNPSSTRSTAYDPKAPVYVPNPGKAGDGAVWQRRQKIMGQRQKEKIFPLFVPPVFEKGTQIVGVLRSLWEKAEELLANASVVVVWGYSLPLTDYHAEMLFAQGARRSHSRLIVVNPSRGALAHVTEICGHRWNRWFFSASDLLRALEEDKATYA